MTAAARSPTGWVEPSARGRIARRPAPGRVDDGRTGVGEAPDILSAVAGPDDATTQDCQRLGRAAVVALYDEVALHPKPGLVSFVDAGSHTDMTGATFLRSLFSLRRCFPHMAALGAAGAGFEALEQLGIQAERRMLQATGGINTHRGAIFLLGLLCAAGGQLQAKRTPITPGAVRDTMQRHWGAALHARRTRSGDSQGRRAARAHGLRSAGDEAALGFPVLFDTTLPALRRALAAGLGPRQARLQALLATLAVLDDTNLAHRGGLDGLRWAQGQAAALLARGGLHRPGALADLEALHHRFVARRLSPGGSADVLAAACWLDRIGADFDDEPSRAAV